MLYSDLLMSAVKNFNQPVKSTSTTTLKGNEGLDIGSLMMALMMSGMFSKPKTATANTGVMSALGSMPNASSMSSVPDALGSSAVPGWQDSTGGAGGLSSLLQILSKLGPLFQS